IMLGTINYASLYFLVATLSRSGLASSSVFPLLNIGVILISTLLGIVLFGDRLHRVQAIGIAMAVIAMVLILSAQG
ncbi:MAG TPA: EamA/RhaT family transporter, partial [Flavobacteriales bacterium]|nr:EamA/RhaT family transporter [Flavobacteriales bacterium]